MNNEFRTRFRQSGAAALLLMALPCFLLVIAFSYVPLFGWAYAFVDYKPGLSLQSSPFVGLKFFELAWNDSDLIRVLRNTFAISLLGVIVSPLAVFFAILLHDMPGRAVRKFVQTVTTLPYFISWILVYSIFFIFFSVDEGFVNVLLYKLGWIEEYRNILGDNGAVWYFQTAVGIWKGLGFSAIIYLAAIAGIDPELHDAANVDGAGRFQRMWHITLPGIAPTYINLLLLSIGAFLSNGLDQYFVFYNPLVHDRIEVLDLFVYRIGIRQNDYSFSTAIGISKTLVSLVLLFTANAIAKRLRGQSII
jgi:ABC-type polysaccharide transport system permease subunit